MSQIKYNTSKCRQVIHSSSNCLSGDSARWRMSLAWKQPQKRGEWERVEQPSDGGRLATECWSCVQKSDEWAVKIITKSEMSVDEWWLDGWMLVVAWIDASRMDGGGVWRESFYWVLENLSKMEVGGFGRKSINWSVVFICNSEADHLKSEWGH